MSQVSSLGGNFNNRSEEIVGSAADLWVAHHHGAYGDGPKRQNYGIGEHAPSLLNHALQSDPRPPFLAWLMLLEDCKGSRTPVPCMESRYPVFPEVRGDSYAQRYQILCEHLVEQQLCSAVTLELSPRFTYTRSIVAGHQYPPPVCRVCRQAAPCAESIRCRCLASDCFRPSAIVTDRENRGHLIAERIRSNAGCAAGVRCSSSKRPPLGLAAAP